MNEWREARRGGREKILNLPTVVTAVLGALLLVQLAMSALPFSMVEALYAELAFTPARISSAFWPEAAARVMAPALRADVDPAELVRALGAEPVPWWSFVTYALLHASWTHLTVNGVTLAAFGSPLARRIGPARFLVFLALTAVAGAAAHFAVHPFDLAPVVGASAAISGTMAASARFAFARFRAEGEPSASPQGASLSELWRNRQALTFVGLWFGVNLLFGLFPRATGETELIAWEAHVGGFVAGLLLFGLLDPRGAKRAI
ncbi:rhomboid family intramembrane serine protease [Methylosinus sp. Sm6]|uniref:rhomboid family intramembrane serine protease n=1 Tax=Methylosinus sp. Sm6 TaxID=2866948 RepID=UPI001C99875E|nr:rhomboid family intramembrane serine protease [Methylosinus sp. Sm6]MBY6240639.1 rhomboid family intramembrane serine protease [Methylosinus sp. Sm6]